MRKGTVMADMVGVAMVAVSGFTAAACMVVAFAFGFTTVNGN